MFRKNPDERAQSLDRTIVRLQEDMQTYEPDSEQYANCLNRLERLMTLKAKSGRKELSPDTLVLVAGNLAGIVIIVAWEHGHAITSKALSFAGKMK